MTSVVIAMAHLVIFLGKKHAKFTVMTVVNSGVSCPLNHIKEWKNKSTCISKERSLCRTQILEFHISVFCDTKTAGHQEIGNQRKTTHLGTETHENIEKYVQQSIINIEKDRSLIRLALGSQTHSIVYNVQHKGF